jgi:hypothetical protein
MEEKLGINVVNKASEVLEELSRLEGRIQELMRDEEFMSYIESRFVKADEETVKKEILETALLLKHALARYRLSNDELDEAERLFNEAAEEYREIGDYENYLVARGLALRVEAINGSLAGDELIKLRNEFQRLYEETFSKEHFEYTARYLSIASHVLGDYLVSLALTGNYEKIDELLEEHWQVLNANKQASVLTRLMLNALLGSKDRKDQLGSELEGRLSVNPGELIDAFGSYMYSEFLPALIVAFGVIKKPEDGVTMCMLINDSTKGMDCVYAISVAMNDNAAVVQLRGRLIDTFSERILEERLNLLKGLGVNADKLLNMFDEFTKLVYGLDGKSLAQLIAPRGSMARLALMLRALINGDEELAKAHALIGTVGATDSKLLRRLFLEAYRACCDLGKEEFRHAVAKLFFYHV